MGSESAAVQLDWAFGAGEQAVTFVSRIDADWYLEHSLSYYSGTNALGVTPGHLGLESSGADELPGVRYRIFSPKAEILNCFGCHSTGPLQLGDGYGIEPSEPGVRCEACHGGGLEHARAAAAGDVDGARQRISNPGSLVPDDLNAYCGACHRPPQSDPADIDWHDPWNVRHQPVYLSRSQCFLADQGLSCVSCHDPHAPLLRDRQDHYNAQCMNCHTEARIAPADQCPPTDAAACSSCHMPQVLPQPELAFTNHWIGVYEKADKLQPRR